LLLEVKAVTKVRRISGAAAPLGEAGSGAWRKVYAVVASRSIESYIRYKI
jgi:hypothetical protein